MDLRAAAITIGRFARTPLAPVPTLLALLVGSVLAWGTVHLADQVWPRVTISDSAGYVHSVRCAGTVADALRLAQVELGPHDRLSAPLDMRVPYLQRVHIRRAIPVTIVTATGEFELWTIATDISGLKLDPRLEMRPLDRLWPRSGTPLTPGMRVKLARVTTSEATETESVQPPVDFIHDAALPRGASVLVSKGKPGVQEVRVISFFKDGLFSGTQRLPGAIVKAAVPEIRKIGVRALSLSRGERGNQVLTMEATAYEPGPRSCGPYADGYTATGRKATYGVCAVDPRVIPLGTRLFVEGYGIAVAADTGGAIKGLKIDVCFDTVPEALRWGRRTVKVYILDDLGGKTIPIVDKQGTTKKLIAVSTPSTGAPKVEELVPPPGIDAPSPEPAADPTPVETLPAAPLVEDDAPVDLLPAPIDLLPAAVPVEDDAEETD